MMTWYEIGFLRNKLGMQLFKSKKLIQLTTSW